MASKKDESRWWKVAGVALLIGVIWFSLSSSGESSQVRSNTSKRREQGGAQRFVERLKQAVTGPGAPKEVDMLGQEGMLLVMAQPDLEVLCDYPGAFLNARKLREPGYLEKASGCGTKIVAVPYNKTKDVLNDTGVGLDLAKLEAHLKDMMPLLEPYIADATIMALGVIDEPHDCNNDWGGKCPTPQEVDQAAQIAEKYVGDLPIVVNTLPTYGADYSWQHVDVIQYQYAAHKGDLGAFVERAEQLVDESLVKQLAWAIQAKAGGCETFRECPMTPDQVVEVGAAMCDSTRGAYVAFVAYDEELLTPEMEEAIDEVVEDCLRVQ